MHTHVSIICHLLSALCYPDRIFLQPSSLHMFQSLLSIYRRVLCTSFSSSAAPPEHGDRPLSLAVQCSARGWQLPAAPDFQRSRSETFTVASLRGKVKSISNRTFLVIRLVGRGCTFDSQQLVAAPDWFPVLKSIYRDPIEKPMDLWEKMPGFADAIASPVTNAMSPPSMSTGTVCVLHLYVETISRTFGFQMRAESWGQQHQYFHLPLAKGKCLIGLHEEAARCEFASPNRSIAFGEAVKGWLWYLPLACHTSSEARGSAGLSYLLVVRQDAHNWWADSSCKPGRFRFPPMFQFAGYVANLLSFSTQAPIPAKFSDWGNPSYIASFLSLWDGWMWLRQTGTCGLEDAILRIFLGSETRRRILILPTLCTE